MVYRAYTSTGPLRSHLLFPGQELMTYQAIFIAALAEGASDLSDILLNENTKAFITALHQAGIAIQLDEKNRSCIVAGCAGTFPRDQATLWCGSSALGTHLLLAACAMHQGVFHFDGPASLDQGNLIDILTELRKHGIQTIPHDAQHFPFTLEGKEGLQYGDIIAKPSHSTAFLSALLLTAPYAPVTLDLKEIPNHDDINATCSIMKEFGVPTQLDANHKVSIPADIRYTAKDYTIEPDLSLATYFFAAAAITHGEISIQLFEPQTSTQPEHIFISLLENIGCKTLRTQRATIIKAPTELKGIDANLPHFTSMFTALSVIAPFAMTPTRITHTGTITEQESARLRTLKNLFIHMNIRVESGENWIRIHPSIPQGEVMRYSDDPYIGMALVVLGLRVTDIAIENSTSITKLYPTFFTLWNKLIGEMHVQI